MKNVSPTQLGELFRQLRKENEYRLEDLAEPGLSPSMISYIERGKSQTNKNVKQLAEKLGYSWDEIKKKLEDRKDELKKEDEKTYNLYIAAHTLCELLDPKEGLRKLDDEHLPKDSPYHTGTYYFKGNMYLNKGEFDKALRCFEEAIRITGENPSFSIFNVPPMSYRYIAYISYKQGNLEKALQMIDKGIQTYKPHSTRTYPIHRLKVDRANYLIKLGQREQAYKEANAAWKIRKEFVTSQLILELTDIYTCCLKNNGEYNKAISILQDGIYAARLNLSNNISCLLWTSLGLVYYEIQDYEEAKNCYQTAIDLHPSVTNNHYIAHSFQALGSVYLIEEEWTLAEEYLTKAIKYFKKDKSEFELFFPLMDKGKVYAKQSLLSEAEMLFKQAYKLAHSQNRKDDVLQALCFMAKCYKVLDRKKYYVTIEKAFDRYLQEV